MGNKCYVIKLRKTINDDNLDILVPDGVVRYNAMLIQEGLETDPPTRNLHFGAAGEFEAEIQGAEVSGIIPGVGEASVQHCSGNVYTVSGDTGSALSGVVLNGTPTNVGVEIKNGLDNLTYIPFTDINIEDIPDGVKYIVFGRAGGRVHAPINLSDLSLASKTALEGLTLTSTHSSGDISVFSAIDDKTKLKKVELIDNESIIGDIRVFSAFTYLETLSLNATGITGDIEDFVRGQVQAGRASGNIFISNAYNVEIYITIGGIRQLVGEVLGTTYNTRSKRVVWSTSGENITMYIYCVDDVTARTEDIVIPKNIDEL